MIVFARLIVATTLCLLSSLPAVATPCDEAANRMMANVDGLEFKKRDVGGSPDQVSITFSHPGTDKEINVACAPGGEPTMLVAWSNLYPPSEFYDLAAKAGSASSGASEKAIKKAAKKCAQMAIKGQEGFAVLTIKGALIECAADVTPGVVVMVSPE